ncbi:MAG TPA: AmmeMemoRadiSam system protein A [Tepidisphaeraceae bacterium]|nr:AmmeMemoRadiSam system protein A [Tepidisphaeraceae bacterium]
MELSHQHRQILLNAARTCIREVLRGNGRISIPTIEDPMLQVAAGCFVTLHEQATHRLRGCIGRMQTTDPLIRTVCEMACSVLHDPRFRSNRIILEELVRLEIEISVLSPLKLAEGPLDFDLLNDGIYLTCNGQTGTFLPQVARETGWTREQLLGRLCTEKMGLAAEAWREPEAKLFKYNVLLIGPVPFEDGAEPMGSGYGGALTNNGNTLWML